MKIAVLALQGDFAEHRKKLEECGAETINASEDVYMNGGALT